MVLAIYHHRLVATFSLARHKQVVSEISHHARHLRRPILSLFFRLILGLAHIKALNKRKQPIKASENDARNKKATPSVELHISNLSAATEKMSCQQARMELCVHCDASTRKCHARRLAAPHSFCAGCTPSHIFNIAAATTDQPVSASPRCPAARVRAQNYLLHECFPLRCSPWGTLLFLSAKVVC